MSSPLDWLGERALVLAPMDGITDATMRSVMGEIGSFSYAVTEFVRVSQDPVPSKVFRREVPELANGGLTSSGMRVQVQILGGHPERMAITAVNAIRAGATAIDINFGCPAPTVNRNDGGATLLQYPCRIEDLVRAVRDVTPPNVSVSAKLRLGWESPDEIDENAARAIAGGASWLTLHARTRMQGYRPPVFWDRIARVRQNSAVPVIANGDIHSVADFRRCAEETGCQHFMIGRAALARPELSAAISRELGLPTRTPLALADAVTRFIASIHAEGPAPEKYVVARVKQWLALARQFGNFADFEEIKRQTSVSEILEILTRSTNEMIPL